MYRIHLRSQASKLAALRARLTFARIQHPAAAAPRRRTAPLRAALAALANLATLRVMLGNASESTERQDPRDPQNW
jgi:hypothetical protein